MNGDSLVVSLQTQNADTTFDPIIVDFIGWSIVAILVFSAILFLVLMIRFIFDL